jgi:hypothetical protein
MADTQEPDENGREGDGNPAPTMPSNSDAQTPQAQPTSDAHNQQVQGNRERYIYGPTKTAVKWLDAHNAGVMAIATIVIMVATIVNVWYVGGQLSEMQSGSAQTDQLIRSNADLASAANIQGAASKTQADAAVRQAEALTGQLSVMQKQLSAVRNEQRPWIAIVPIMKVIAVGQKLEAVVTFANVGHTPAFKVLTVVNGFGLSPAAAPPEPMTSLPADAKSKEGNGKVILPTTNVSATVPWAEGKPLSQLQFDSLQNNAQVLWVAARVEYFDDGGDVHSTSLRASYDFSNASFLSVNPGNDAD